MKNYETLIVSINEHKVKEKFPNLGKRIVSYNKRQRKTVSPVTHDPLQPESNRTTV